MMGALIDRYLALRRGAGFQLVEEARRLRSFERFSTARSLDHVKSEAARQWAAQGPSPQHREKRLRAVRLFARFARVEDARHEIPPKGLFRASEPRRPAPRIYTSEEIDRLLQAARNLGPEGSLWPLAFAPLLALLYAVGLRISEALQLRLPDLTDDGLLIRKAKFNKTRLLPLQPTTRKALQDYLHHRRRAPGADDHLFLGQRGRPLCRSRAEKVFRRLVARAALATPGRPRPRLHDMRHTFAVRALMRCPKGRHEVGRYLLALSTYLGHARVGDTYWYLEAVPELMDDIRLDLEHFLKGAAR